MWTKEKDTTFINLNECLNTPPILRYPDPNQAVIHDNATRGCSTGGVLLQMQYGNKVRYCLWEQNVVQRREKLLCHLERIVGSSIRHQVLLAQLNWEEIPSTR